MPTIDDLAIELNGSSTDAEKAVQNVIDALKKLKTSLNIEFGSELTTSLNDLSGSLSNLNTTISGIDTKKVRDLGRALGSLSTNAGKLAGLSKFKIDTKGIQGAESAMERAFGHMSKEAKETATNLAKMYDIDPSKFEDLGKRVQSLYDSNGSSGARDDLIRFIDLYGDLEKELTYNAQKAKELQKIMSSGLAIPENLKRNVTPDQFKQIQGITGIKNFKYAKNAKSGELSQFDGPTGWAERADKIFGNYGINGKRFQDMTDASEGFLTAAEFLGKYKDQMETTSEAAEALTYHIHEIAQAIQQNNSAMSQMPKDNGWMEVSDSDADLFDLGSVESQASSLDTLASSIQNVAEVVEVNPFETISRGIESLNGLEVPDFSSIKMLADSVGKLSGENVTAAADAMPKIAQGIKNFDNVSIPNIDGVAKLASNLRSLGSKRIREAADALPKIFSSLSSMKSVTLPNTENIAEFAKAIAMLGRQGVEKAIANMPRLADAFNQMAAGLSKAPAISENTVRLAQAMGQLSGNALRTGNSMGHASKRLNLFNNMARNGIKSTGGLARTIGKIYATYWLLFRAFGKIKEAIDISSDLTEVQNVVDTVFGDARDKVQEFADSAIMSFGMSELSAKEFASRFQAMGSAMGITDKAAASANEYLSKTLEKTKRNVEGVTDSYKDLGKTSADMSINLSKLAADMGSFYNKDYAEVAEDLNAVYTGMTRPLRTYGLDLTQATLKEWAMTNGLNSNIEKMTQAQKTMLRYQYVMANMGHVMNDYAITANTWANVTRTIGEQFKKLGQLIGEGLINTFKPALIKFRDFLNGLIGLTEKTLNAIGKLLGWQVEIAEVGIEGAADGAEDLAGGLGDAADNAKKLNKQLAGFDRLNNLTTPSDGGGSGSGTGGASGGSGGKSQASGGGVTYKPYESEIDSWRGLGEAIADTISKELDSIKWENVYKKAEKFGQGLADFMNGLFSGEKGKKLFESLGSTIAGAVNTVMIAAKTWADELEWEKIGSNIKDGLVKFLKDWKPEIEGEAVGGIASGIASAVYSAVSDMSAWELLGDKIGTGIQALIDRLGKKDRQGNTFWENFFGSIASVANGLSKAIIKGVEAVNWDDLGHAIVKGIKKFVKTWRPDLTGIAIGKVANAIADTLYPILADKQTWKNLGKKIGSGINAFLKTVKWDKALGDITNALLGIATAIASALNEIDWGAVAKAVAKGIKGALKELADDPEGLYSLLEVAAVYFGLKAGMAIVKGMVASGGIGKGISTAAGGGTLKDTIGKSIAESLKGSYRNGTIMTNFAWSLGVTEMFVETKQNHDRLKNGDFFVGTEEEAENMVKAKEANNPLLKVADDMARLFKAYMDKKPFSADVTLALKKGTTDKLYKNTKKSWDKSAKDGLDAKVKENVSKEEIIRWWDSVNQKWIYGTKDKYLATHQKDVTTQEDVDGFFKKTQNYWGSTERTVSVKQVDSTTNADIGKWYDNTRKKWVYGTKAKYDSWLKVKQRDATTDKDISGWFSTTKSKWGTKKLGVGMTTSSTYKSDLNTGENSVWGKTKNAWGTKTLSVNLDTSDSALKTWWKKIGTWVNGHQITGSTPAVKAKGGSFFGGKWHNIPQYASGGLPSHGTMFMAGEAGAEVVGHVGGRTEVLNESQLASTMYSAVSSAMAQQNAILLKQNEYLSGILAKDYGISSRDIFNATRSEANSYFNRTGRPAFEG